jgi:DNA-binding winged helix-turn-helix (wHTH) protein
MTSNGTPSYQFDHFLLDVGERRLYHRDTLIPLTPKAFDVLAYLAERDGHLVLKEELLQAIWPDRFVEEVNLARAVHTIRSTLAELDNATTYIETVPTKGYRFVAKVERLSPNLGHLLPLESSLPSAERQLESSVSADPEKPPIFHQFINLVNRAGLGQSNARTIMLFVIPIVLMAALTGAWFAARYKENAGIKSSLVQTKSGEAYRLYQQGRFLIERSRGDDLKQALVNFEKAIDLDPNFAAAYAGKADTKMWIFWGSALHDDISQARTAIDKAIKLDESNSYAHTLLCRLKGTYDYDFNGAESECRRAIELDPNDHEARRELALLLNAFGREEDALAEMNLAVELAPTSFNKRARGMILYYSRRYDEAIEQWRQVVDTDPTDIESLRWLMNVYELKGEHSSAFEVRIRQMEMSGAPPEDIETTKVAFNESGWPGVLKSTVDPKRPSMSTATKYAQLGDNDRAIQSLEDMFERRAIMVIQSGREPRLDPLRNDPRFIDLLKRIGLQ